LVSFISKREREREREKKGRRRRRIFAAIPLFFQKPHSNQIEYVFLKELYS
jgi:hypothetical protein